MPDELPKPNAWRKTPNAGAFLLFMLAVGALILCACFLVSHYDTKIDIRPAAPVQPVTERNQLPAPSHTLITHTVTSTGEVHESAVNKGGSISGTGDKADIKGANLAPGAVGLSGITSSGGGLIGSVTASVSGQMWIRILGLLAFVGCGGLAVLSFKKTPTDWHQWGGLGVGALGGFLVMIQPDLLWIGCGVGAVAALCTAFPSRQAGKLLSAGQNYEDFFDDPANADIKARWSAYRSAKVTSADKTTIDTIIKKSNV